MVDLTLRKFEISAPGKIILHGEHSVVYGKPSIAGPVGLRTSFLYEETSQKCINLICKKLNFSARLSLDNANLLLSEINCLETLQPIDFLHKIRESNTFILKYVEVTSKDNLDDRAELSLATTLYLFNRVFKGASVSTVKSGFDITIDSNMSIGAGQGSSASFGVCLAAGFHIIAQLANESLTVDQLKVLKLDEGDLEIISKWSFDSEVIMHETPSGIDNTICTYGKLIKFSRGVPVETINLKKDIHILLVDTMVSRSTSHLVGRVANFRNKYSSLANSIFDSIGYLVEDVIQILESDKEEKDRHQELGVLISTNNNLLRSLGVSHSRLDQVFAISENLGFHAKLTGAGGGGCAFILLPKDYKKLDDFKTLCKDLETGKFSFLETTIEMSNGVNFKFLQ